MLAALAALLLSADAPTAETALQPKQVDEFSATVVTTSYSSFYYSTQRRWALDVSYLREHDALQFGGGIRAAVPLGSYAPLEVYARARLVAPVGEHWQPAAGFELGYSGLTQLKERA